MQGSPYKIRKVPPVLKLQPEHFGANEESSECRIVKVIVNNSKLDLVRFAASNITHYNHDLWDVINHRYFQPPRGKKSDQFSAFVQVSVSDDTQPEVWNDFSTQGKPIINLRRATRAYDENLPYIVLYELRTSPIG